MNKQITQINVPEVLTRFWMVKGEGPTSIHQPTIAAARAEAKRLASLNPGKKFVVLEANEYFVVDSPISHYSL